MTTALRLDVLNPRWLEAKKDTDAARVMLRRAEDALAWMHESNGKHAVELETKSRSGLAILTNAEVHARGSGSGFEVIYSRCLHDDPDDVCLHDPTEAPYATDALDGAQRAIGKAQAALATSEKRLASRGSGFDAFENARTVGARFCWWPQDRLVDPRIRRWRGMPVSDNDVAALGVHELNRALANGSVIEVPE